MRTRLLAAAVVIVVILAFAGAWSWRAFNPGPMAFIGGGSVPLGAFQGTNPTGVPQTLANADIVARGAYLARAADCLVCHTQPGGRAYAGGLAFPLPFGTIYSTNITADKDTGIGNYSDQDFLRAVRDGVRPDGTHLYPAMPFASYTLMTDDDALAIKAYLFSLTAVHAQNRPGTLGFPYNQRWSMGIWSWLFSPNARFAPNATQSADWNRGAYLAEALAHCGECHTPRNFAFAMDNRRKFAGAIAAGWHAFNITSDKYTGIGAWTDDELIAFLADGHASGHGTASGPMGEAVDESFAAMDPQDIRALVAYLRTIPAVASPDLPPTLAPAAPSSPEISSLDDNPLGKRVFEGACLSCHNWTGVSSISPYATITGARAINDRTATNVAQIILSGTARQTPPDILSMPAFGSGYSDVEIAAVANYVTGRFGSAPSHVAPADVARLRKETAY